jgi:hypothetical protein
MPGLGRRHQFVDKTLPIFRACCGPFRCKYIREHYSTFSWKSILCRAACPILPLAHQLPTMGLNITFRNPSAGYATRSDTINLILGVLLVVIVFTFRKSIHRVR